MAVVGVGLAAVGSGRDIVGDVGDVGRRIGGKAAILGRRTQRRTVVIADRVENAAVGDPMSASSTSSVNCDGLRLSRNHTFFIKARPIALCLPG